jgi:hypothetical protein
MKPGSSAAPAGFRGSLETYLRGVGATKAVRSPPAGWDRQISEVIADPFDFLTTFLRA